MLDLVTIVIPVYNGEQFIRENIESILNQTYTNLEIICVCAGCTDASVEILHEYAKTDARLVLHVEQTNHGPAYSRNIGMAMAQGEWIIFLDCDDLFELDMIEIMLNRAIEEQADLCCCFWDCFDENSSGMPAMTDETIKYLCNTYPVINVSAERRHLFQLIAFNVWTKLIHKTIYQKEIVNFGNFPNCEDFYFSLIAAIETEKIVYVNQVLVHYRINTSRYTQTTMMNKKKSYEWEAADAVFQHIRSKGYKDELMVSFFNCICSHILYAFQKATNAIYHQLCNELYDVYMEKWGMRNNNMAEKLSYINQEIYVNVLNGNTELDIPEIVMNAKVHFVKNMAEKGKCAIWGCGYWGQKLLERLNDTGIRVSNVFDSDSNKWGVHIYGQVIEPFHGKKVDCVIVTSSKYYEEIRKQIGNSVDMVYDLEKQIFAY